MAMKFFKKLIPKTKVVLNSGAAVQFQTLDGLTGYRQTLNPSEIADYESFMRQQRYGISEISEEEYERDFVEKKRLVGLTQLPTWNRESLGETPSRPINPLHSLGAAAVRAAVGIEGGSDIRMEEFPVGLPVAPVQAKSTEPEAKPVTLGKRK